jgi:hypothetical protein
MTKKRLDGLLNAAKGLWTVEDGDTYVCVLGPYRLRAVAPAGHPDSITADDLVSIMVEDTVVFSHQHAI